MENQHALGINNTNKPDAHGHAGMLRVKCYSKDISNTIVNVETDILQRVLKRAKP